MRPPPLLTAAFVAAAAAARAALPQVPAFGTVPYHSSVAEVAGLIRAFADKNATKSFSITPAP